MKKFIWTVYLCAFVGILNAQNYNIANVTKAIEDMSKDPSYPREYLTKLEAFKKNNADPAAFDAFAREALLANPLLKKHKDWVYIKRPLGAENKALPFNWQGNSSLNKLCHNNTKTYPNSAKSFKDELWTIDITKPEKTEYFFKPEGTYGITDVDVKWEGDKLLYSSVNAKNNWQIYELDLKTKKTRLLTVEKYDEVDNSDGVYLPDGNMIYMSTACYAAVPCVRGSDHVANLYKLNPNLTDENARDDSIRQLSFDQENSWSPTVMNDGRLMFTR